MNGNTPHITPEWERLMERVARLQYGDITITVHQGKPTMIVRETQKLKLDGTDDDWKREMEMKPLL